MFARPSCIYKRHIIAILNDSYSRLGDLVGLRPDPDCRRLAGLITLLEHTPMMQRPKLRAAKECEIFPVQRQDGVDILYAFLG